MSTLAKPLKEWLASATRQELVDAVLWLQSDARWLYAAAARYRDTPGQGWIAIEVQNNAARSAAGARDGLLRLLAEEAIESSTPKRKNP